MVTLFDSRFFSQVARGQQYLRVCGPTYNLLGQTLVYLTESTLLPVHRGKNINEI